MKEENQDLHVEVIERRAFSALPNMNEASSYMLLQLMKWVADPWDVNMQAFKVFIQSAGLLALQIILSTDHLLLTRFNLFCR